MLTFALAQANNSARNKLSVQEKLIDELRKKNLEQEKSDQQQGTSARLRAAAMANLRAAEATVESQEAEISKLVALVEQYEGSRKLEVSAKEAEHKHANLLKGLAKSKAREKKATKRVELLVNQIEK